MHPRFLPILASVMILSSLFLFGWPVITHAGCGCDKPPPPPAAIRPSVTYSGTPVTFFGANLQPRQTYTVTFRSSANGRTVSVTAQAELRRDLADGQYKPQLSVTLPTLPLGPTSVSVQIPGQTGAVRAFDDSAFTVAPQPVVVPAQLGSYYYKNFQAAVSRAGVVYLSLDLSNVTDPEIFLAQAMSYPLRFDTGDAVFYNTQGYLMQMLNADIPGLAAVDSPNKARDSDILEYSRHEFNSFFLAHQERQPHAVDPLDPNWHLDGTRHVDHNHLLLALSGRISVGGKAGKQADKDKDGLPDPGATPNFELRLTTASLFSSLLIGSDSIDIGGDAMVIGDIQSNGVIKIKDNAKVDGDATGTAVTNSSSKKSTMSQGQGSLPGNLLPVYTPKLLTDLNNIELQGSQTLTLGPGTYQVSNLRLSGNSTLLIENLTGPVTLYVMGSVQIAGSAQIATMGTGPEDFALYVQGGGAVDLVGKSVFYGLVYAPQSLIALSGDGDMYGAFVGKQITLHGNVTLHYDTTSTVTAPKASKKPKK